MAARPTNNAGEIIALLVAIIAVTRAASPGDTAAFHTDSTHALIEAHGYRTNKRKPKRGMYENLKRRLRRAYADLRAKLGAANVHVLKVKAHSGHAWNDVADALAADGRARASSATAETLDKGRRALDLEPKEHILTQEYYPAG